MSDPREDPRAYKLSAMIERLECAADRYVARGALELIDELREERDRAMLYLSQIIHDTDGPGDYTEARQMVREWKKHQVGTESGHQVEEARND